MNGCYITFRSVTLAQQGEAALNRAGIGCRILRTPRWMEEQGCGYCLALKRRDLGTALERLAERGIRYRKCYRKTESGELEEVRP